MIVSNREMVDTNILIYAHDPDSRNRQECALELIQLLTQQGRLAVSVQVLNEFYVAATRPHKPPSLDLHPKNWSSLKVRIERL